MMSHENISLLIVLVLITSYEYCVFMLKNESDFNTELNIKFLKMLLLLIQTFEFIKLNSISRLYDSLFKNRHHSYRQLFIYKSEKFSSYSTKNKLNK